MTDASLDRLERAQLALERFLARRDAGEAVTLEALIAEHPDLEAELRELHAVFDQVPGALAAEAQGRAAVGAQSDALLTDFSGTNFTTRYAVEGEIGKGGMGAVYRVVDRKLDRPLAMKVILGQTTPTVTGNTPPVPPHELARFLNEAKITSQLDHPGIVPVHEVGVDGAGRAYFTMKLVKGKSLRDIIEMARTGEEGWNQTRVLGVVQRICEAVAYAHDKGVIHRDLKPANVMVGRYGEAYVMDWGLARVMGDEDRRDLRLRADAASLSSIHTLKRDTSDSDSPLVTMDGAVVGTPAYMSPEQARGDLDQVGPKSDVYSLGAMLYHAITSHAPYVAPNTKPSARTILARLLDGPPKRIEELEPRTPAELVSICEKAMQREVASRYANVASFAEDLRAYLEHRVVTAYESGAWAETKKWMQRNRALAGALAAVLVVAVGGAIAFQMQATRAEEAAQLARNEGTRADAEATAAKTSAGIAEQRAEEARLSAEAAVKAREQAERSAKTSKAVTEFVQSALISADPNQAGDQSYRVVDAMEKAIKELEPSNSELDPETRAALMLTIAEILQGNARPEAALRLAEQALATRQQLHSGDHADVANALNHVGSCLDTLGRSSEALPKYEAALEMGQRLFQGDHPAIASYLNNIAYSLDLLGRIREALPKYEAALEMRQRLKQGDNRDVVVSLNNVAVCLDSLGRSDEALPKLEAALSMCERLFPGDHPYVATTLENFAASLDSLGRFDEALPRFGAVLEMRQRLFQGDHEDVATSLSNVAGCLSALGRYAEALPKFQASSEMLQRLFRGDHPRVAVSLNNVGTCLDSLGRSDEALTRFEAAWRMCERLFPEDHPFKATTFENVADCQFRLGGSDEALPKFEEVLEMRRRLFRGDHSEVATSLTRIGHCLESLARRDEALARFEAALAMHQRLFQGDHPTVATSLYNVATCLYSLKRGDEAVPRFEAAVNMQQRLFKDGHPNLVLALNNLAICLGSLGRMDEALPYAENAFTMAERILALGDPNRAGVTKTLDWIRTSLEQPSRAASSDR